jgi:hypothetical protein
MASISLKITILSVNRLTMDIPYILYLYINVYHTLYVFFCYPSYVFLFFLSLI